MRARLVLCVLGRLLRRVVVAGLVALASVSASAQAATLDEVRARGHLICGATNPLPGFAQKSPDGLWSGFDVDFCRAVAAAVFGDPNLVEFRALSGQSRFANLQTGQIDVISRNAPWSLQRDIGFDATYVGTSFFDGQAFMVRHGLGVVSAYELRDISICAVEGEQLNTLREFFFENQASYVEVIYEDREDLGVAYRAGLCDAVSAPASWLYAIRRALPEPGTHRILPERISKEPYGPVVRDGDIEWFNIVRWTLFTLINAEEVGLTSLNLQSMAAVRTPAVRRVLGLEADYGKALRLKPTWMRDVVAAVGNYGEMFDRNFGPQTGAALLRGMNSLWTKGGLMFAPPIQ